LREERDAEGVVRLYCTHLWLSPDPVITVWPDGRHFYDPGGGCGKGYVEGADASWGIE
jgi:hypothetical protein